MADMEGDSRGVPEKEVDDAEEIRVTNENNTDKVMNHHQKQQEEKNKMKKNKKKRRSLILPRFGCLRTESIENGGVDMEVQFPGGVNDPTHLVIMVNGIIGSAQNWRFAAKQFLKKYPGDVIVHCSERNSSTLTFDGVDVPLFGGSRALEKLAARTSWLFGRTGKHLFLKDGKNGKPPLLFQMVSDCEDLKFITALQSFRRRVAYANADFDRILYFS
ncbi:putative Hydrolase [Hibiscus syriacus]|uniref:Hydrolase n=1 Tax=Hibiscus syriacus TaxID=106335 RepID=A0A6A3BUV6_HIBSY|nr:putative Hydrolase [Hibiscus syriacus]